MRRSGLRQYLLFSSVLFCTVSVAPGQQYWDTNGSAAGLGGTGDWNLSTANWNNSSGTGAAQTWNNTTTSDAVFDGTAGTVTVSVGGVQVNDMTFSVTGYTVGGSNALTLAGTTPSVTVSGSNTATLDVQLSGSAGLTKLGGTGSALVLTNSSNNYSGLTIVGGRSVNFAIPAAAGTLRLGASNVIPDASNFDVGDSSTLDLNGFSETVHALHLERNANVTTTTGSTGVLTTNADLSFYGAGTVTSGTGTGKTVLGGTDSHVWYVGRDRNSGFGNINGRLDLNDDRVASRVFRVASILETSGIPGVEIDRPIQMNAIVADGVSSAGIVKTGEGGLDLFAANTYTGGTTVIEGEVNVIGSGGRLGANVVGNNVVVDGGGLSLANAANIGANQTLTVNSKPHRLGVLSLGFNAVPTFSTSTDGVLAINMAGFNAVSDMSTVGNGEWFLGATALSGSTFTGAALAPGAGNTYRLGGGSGVHIGGALTITNGVLTGNNDVVIGSPRGSGQGVIILQGSNSYTGSTTLNSSGLAHNRVTLTLSGANGAITGSSSITLNNGFFNFDNASGNNNNRLGDSIPVIMNGSEVKLVGHASVASSETIGALSVNSGSATVTVDAAAGGASTLTAASLSRNPGTSIVFRGDSLGGAPAANVGNVKFSSAPALVGNSTLGGTDAGILPYALADTSITGIGTAFATYDTNGIRGLGAGETTSTVTANQNVRLTASASTGSVTINSLELSGTSTLSGTAATGETLTVTSGGIFTSSGTNTIASSMENLTFGNNAVTGREGVIHTNTALTIASSIVDNGGPVSLTKTGPSSLTLSSSGNSFTGKLAVPGGTLIYTNNNQLGSPATGNETIELANSFLQYNGGATTLTRPIHLNGPSTLFYGSTTTWTISGAITGDNQTLTTRQLFSVGNLILSGPVNLGSAGTLINIGASTTTLSNASNNFGHLIVSGSAIGFGPTTAVKIGVDNAVPTTASLTVYMGQFDLNGHNQTIANLGDNPGRLNHADATAGNRGILNNSTGTGTLTVNNAGTNAFGGSVQGTNFNLTKTNTGELILYGPNTYGGNTTVLNGTLTVQSSLANNGSNKIFIADDADGIFANGAPTLSRARGPGLSYANFGSQVTTGLLTRADILAGDNTSGDDAFVTMQWRLRAGDTNTLPPGGALASEILNLTDMNNSTSSPQTDPFVLQMNYDQATVDNAGSEALAIAGGRLHLAWLDSGSWVNAILGNFGNNAFGLQQNFPGSFSAFQTAHGFVLSSYIGAWGVDSTSNEVWAVLNHNSQFVVLVPEPGAATLLMLGGAVLLRRRLPSRH